MVNGSTQYWDALFSHSDPALSRLGSTWGWEKTQAGQVTPTVQRDVIYHIMSLSAIKTGGKEEEWEIFRVMLFVFPHSYHVCWGPALQEVIEKCPWVGSIEWVPNFTWLVHAVFLHIFNCLYPDLWGFFHFCSSDSSALLLALHSCSSDPSC